MGVTVRPYRNGKGWEVDIRFRLPNGKRHRERSKAPVDSKSGAIRWGQDRERYLLQHGPEPKKKEVPRTKINEFAPTFLEKHAEADRHKPSGIVAVNSILSNHVVPQLGNEYLHALNAESIQRLKLSLSGRSAKTVNNVLTVLNTMVKKAVEWGVIERMPCTIKLLKAPTASAKFHDFGDYELLLAEARAMAWQAELAVLLGGDAGLRLGEITALEWRDVDLAKRQLCVERSEWKGHVTAPKGGRLRHVPLTARLADALRAHRHLRGARVLCGGDGTALTPKTISDLVRRSAKKAGLALRGVHALRHTFCSHLAMRGAPARSIQALAGHQNLSTTERYMHLSPTALNNAIRLLDSHGVPGSRGEMRETAAGESEKA